MFARTKMITAAVIAALSIMVFSMPAFADAVQQPGAYAKKKIADCKKRTKPIAMEEVKTMLGKPGFVLLDCRTEKEFRKGHLPGALNIPRGKLEFVIEKKVKDLGTKMVLYCKSGGRACLSCCTLVDMGYSNVHTMTKGFKQWSRAGYPVE